MLGTRQDSDRGSATLRWLLSKIILLSWYELVTLVEDLLDIALRISASRTPIRLCFSVLIHTGNRLVYSFTSSLAPITTCHWSTQLPYDLSRGWGILSQSINKLCYVSWQMAILHDHCKKQTKHKRDLLVRLRLLRWNKDYSKKAILGWNQGLQQSRTLFEPLTSLIMVPFTMPMLMLI